MAAFVYTPPPPLSSPIFGLNDDHNRTFPSNPGYPTPHWQYRTGNSSGTSTSTSEDDPHSHHRGQLPSPWSSRWTAPAVHPAHFPPTLSALIPQWNRPPPTNLFPSVPTEAAHVFRRPMQATSGTPTWHISSSHARSLTTRIHPWLERKEPDVTFDLSSPSFHPSRIGASGRTPLTREDMDIPATNPPITELDIICDLIPQWPINVRLNTERRPSPGSSLTVYDVLAAVHAALHKRVSYDDWSMLSGSQSRAVKSAFHRRCRHISPSHSVEGELRALMDGVKRVDFLLEASFFQGLVKDEGVADRMKLLVGDKPY